MSIVATILDDSFVHINAGGKMIYLTDGFADFGEGITKEEAVEDAVKNCHQQQFGLDGDFFEVTEEWIQGQLRAGGVVLGKGLYFEERNDSDGME